MAKEKRFTRHVSMAVKTIKTHIDSHPHHGESIAFLAARAGISRNTLREVFKYRYGIEMREYRLRLRMQLARQLFKEERTIMEIYLTLNYSSPGTFMKAFKKFYDLTPTEWVMVYTASTDYNVQ